MYLGTYKMGAWDDWNIEVSNQSSSTGYVIADAVKVVCQYPAPAPYSATSPVAARSVS